MVKDYNRLNSLKYMLILTVPIFVELLLQLVVGYSDQIMMSKYENAVNGITNANTVINMIINVFSVFAAAGIILITQYKGAKDKTREENVYSNAFYFNLILSAIFSLIILSTSKFYLKLIEVPSSAYNDAWYYSMITGSLIFFQALSSTFSGFLKANSYMKESMIVNIIVNIINIIGNLILINVFARMDLPIIGVALSSALSRIIGCILMYLIYKKKVGVKIRFKTFISDFNSGVKKLIKIGAPSGGESISYNSSQIVIQLCVNQIVIYNANNVGIGNIKTYASMFAMVTYMFTSAVSQSMQVIVGELLGAGRVKDANKKVSQTLILATIVSTSISILFWLFSNQTFKIFHVTDPELLAIGKKVMFIEIFLEIGRAFNIVLVRFMQTSGDIMFPTISAVIFCWLVAVFGSFLFGHYNFMNLGLMGVWIAMALDECFRAVLFMIRWKSGRGAKYSIV